jgi:radical SAM protein with 4Fe4S-binding SPASM domain
VKVKSVLTMDDRDMTKAVPFSEPFLKAMHKRGFASLSVEERHYDVARDSRYFDQLHRLGRILLEREGAKDTAALLKPLTPRQRAFYQVTLGQFVDIQAVNRAYQSGRKKVRFRKGCLMGFEDGAVHPNGDISICHKAPSFVIGNVNRGRWDFDKIMEYHDLLVGDWPQCPTCFVQRFCDLCYEKMPGETGGWREARAKFCEFNRTQYRIIIDYMLRILERNPKLWEEFEADVKKTVASASGPPAAPPSI